MKRRRETHRQVRARHAAEEEAASCGGDYGGGSSRNSIMNINNTSMVTALQAGGEGRWKPALSR